MVLVTGATGFIGSHLVERLLAAGEPVRCLVRRSNATLPAGVSAAQGDLEARTGIEAALEGVDSVIHLAGAIKARSSEDYYSGNQRVTFNLVQALEGRRLVHVSSLAAAGPAVDGVPVREDDAPHPFSHYGKSKLAAEEAVRAGAPHAVIIRPPVVYGPRDRATLEIFKPLSKGWAVSIGGGERWFSMVYVRDLVTGILAAAANPRAQGRTYFLTQAPPVSWSELMAAAARIMGLHARKLAVPPWAAWGVGLASEAWSRLSGKPGIVSRDKIAEAQCRWWTCDGSRAASELGFVAGATLDAGLAETLAWYKEAGWLHY